MDAYRYDTEVVRLMYDYTSSVVWFPDPIPHAATGLSSDLVADLDAWLRLHDEQFHYADGWRAPEFEARAEREGPLLAHRIGDELGSAFEVEYDVFGPRRASYRSPDAPTNPAATAAFGALADAARERNEFWRIQAEASRRAPTLGGALGWYAVSPQSGRVFIPPDPDVPDAPDAPDTPPPAPPHRR